MGSAAGAAHAHSAGRQRGQERGRRAKPGGDRTWRGDDAKLELELTAPSAGGRAPAGAAARPSAAAAPPKPKLELEPQTLAAAKATSSPAQAGDSDSDASSVDSMETVQQGDSGGGRRPHAEHAAAELRRAVSAMAAEHAAQPRDGQGSVAAATIARARTVLHNLLATAGAAVALAIGDRRGRMRNAVTAQGRGQTAISIDEAASESDAEGLHIRIDAKLLAGMPRVARMFSFMPCEQQAVSLGPGMAAVKALDGRMFWGIVQWLRV